jgi:anti-sigma regulatory factor (Ser/Thr protein kinase)
LADDTAAIVAELVANAVTASMPLGTPVGFGMTLTDSSVVVEVFDRAPGEPAPGTATPEAESGRGLHIVAALSRQWGWTLQQANQVHLITEGMDALRSAIGFVADTDTLLTMCASID